MKVLAPLLQINVLHTVEIDKALIDAITEVGGRLLTDDHHHTRGQVTIQLIVAAEDGYLLIGELLLHLEIGGTLLDAQRLRLIATSHHADSFAFRVSRCKTQILFVP